MSLGHSFTPPEADRHVVGSDEDVEAEMVDEIATRRNSDDGGATRVAEAADFVWRLATTMGLSSERADDVCFLTLQEAVTTEPESGDAVGHGGLLRAAVDQCAVARCLCAAHPRASAQPPTLQQVLS